MKLHTIVETDRLDDLFGRGDTPRPKVVERQPPTTIPYRLELYRGFDADINQIKQKNGKLILSPAKSE